MDGWWPCPVPAPVPCSYQPDPESEAEHFGTPEAIAIRPQLRWAQASLVLFDLMNVLFQHNVHALVQDALSFYAVHHEEVRPFVAPSMGVGTGV
jgi:hypothetical protein